MNAQESHSSEPKPSNSRPSDIREAIGKRASKAERRAAFAVALRNGCSIAECSRIAGVARGTGTEWAKQFRAQNGLEREREAIVQKQRLAEIYSTIVLDDGESAAYRIDAGSNLSKLMGYDAPSRSQIEVRSVPASVESWMQSCLTIDVAIESDDKQLTERNNQPKALTDKASSE